MNKPIGIFDSGIGGLTVARAVKDLLPKEAIVYFGDTANLPYGDKDAATIQVHALRICDFLLRRHCKVILMACNSAAAAAYDLVQVYVGKRAAVLNVIDPMVNHIGSQFKGQPIGLIGTRQTIQSGIYEKKNSSPAPRHPAESIGYSPFGPHDRSKLYARHQSRNH